MKRFEEWDARFEKRHPRLYGLLTAACGVTMLAAAIAVALMIWGMR